MSRNLVYFPNYVWNTPNGKWNIAKVIGEQTFSNASY